jgi:hypothetical protein
MIKKFQYILAATKDLKCWLKKSKDIQWLYKIRRLLKSK